MAAFQLPDRMLLAFVAVLCIGGVFEMTECCHPNSKELHVCLNIYLEKDFPFIETLIKGRKRGKVLLEDPDLNNICRQVSTLYDCYSELLSECDAYWQMDRYSRLMHVLQSTHSYLCSNSTTILRDLFLNTGCLSRSRDLIANCSETGFSWFTTWKEILRMQVAPADRCLAMEDYRRCLVSRMQEVICGQEAAKVYGDLIDVWLRSWCNKDPSQSDVPKYLYQPLTLPRWIL